MITKKNKLKFLKCKSLKNDIPNNFLNPEFIIYICLIIKKTIDNKKHWKSLCYH